jgi:glycopeptide antibiotics resistance protein
MKPIHPNFRPFLFIETFLDSSGFILMKPGTWLSSIRSASFYTVAFNVVLTIPFGVYIKKYFKLGLPWVVVFGFLLSLFYEVTQYTGLYGIYSQAYRFPDVDDLIVNTVGAVIGYFLSGCIDFFLLDPSKDHGRAPIGVSVFRRLLFLLVDFIVIIILFELSRIAIYWNTSDRKWDLVIFLVSETITFLLFPLLTKRKQTVGMLALKLQLKDGNGQKVKNSRVLLHNLSVGMWICFMLGINRLAPGYGLEVILFQLLSIIWLLVLVYKSFRQRKLCYYWEPLFDTYLVVCQ